MQFDDFVGVRQTIYFHTLFQGRDGDDDDIIIIVVVVVAPSIRFTSRRGNGRERAVDTRKECYEAILMVSIYIVDVFVYAQLYVSPNRYCD